MDDDSFIPQEDKKQLEPEPPKLPPHHDPIPSPRPNSVNSLSSSHTLLSKYAKASYSLTNHPDAIKLYRTMALKTKDPMVQLTYAKYLLEIAQLYDHPSSLPRANRRMSYRPSSLDLGRRSSTEHPPQWLEEQGLKQKRLQEEGVRWIKRLANQKVGEAAYLLGSWLDHGLYGFKKSPTKAIKYYELAAKDRVPQAMFAVAQYHEREQDYMTSFQLYEEAASLGLTEAIYRIAMIHLNGEFGSRQNIKVAIQLLTKACEKSTSYPEAPYTLGLLLLNDYPSVKIPNDLIQTDSGVFQAVSYLGQASEMGMPAAQYKLGHIYEQGKYNHPVDLTKAFEYYQMAATNNHPLAMMALSRLYNQGVQVPSEQAESQYDMFEHDTSYWIKTHPRDEEAAFRWCHLAASDHRLPEAYYLLGWYYEVGTGVPRDYKQAYHYYMKASKSNHKQAHDRALLLENLAKYKKTEKNKKESGSCVVM
ncbi:hypothetical protein G6F52_011597 [Rhizopus delemar]|nr:hypothetical protein G6F52_011597 [Rhizopus delemar]